MQSFRTELEDPVVQRDILELERKIHAFHRGELGEEQFRSLRLARGVYGQRQPGVQMIRIKLPYGKATAAQLRRIADVSDEYSTGRLHITTRQDIQIHHVSLDRTPELWAQLERDDITLREACGNTVRNITASPLAGVDPQEVFDVTPHADAMFRYFLRNPVCQEMGRKIKISFSSNAQDSALAYMHDLGFVAVERDGERGFQVLLGGGLGSQPRQADEVFAFLPEDEIIPYAEAVLRAFDRFGERQRRMKARLKFLLRDIGLEVFLAEVQTELEALAFRKVPIPALDESVPTTPLINAEIPEQLADFSLWERTNVFPQKQPGLVAVGVRVPLGDWYTDQVRALATLIERYAGGEVRFTLRQNFIIRGVPEANLPLVYRTLNDIGLGKPGFETLADITACPGTDTCNLGIASSTGVTRELENVLREEYPAFIHERAMTIKISGCMNACGQHMMAHIGFQGMSIKKGDVVYPALQVLLGGATLGDGRGRFADKVIKVPSRRGPQALRLLLDAFISDHRSGESFLDFYDRLGKSHFYQLLKPLGDTDALSPEDAIDWGHSEAYVKAVGVGECAGVVIDLVSTLLLEAQETLETARQALQEERHADAAYLAHRGIVHIAKALLTGLGKQAPSQHAILLNYAEHFEKLGLHGSGEFLEFANRIRSKQPHAAYAEAYVEAAEAFLQKAASHRKNAAA